MISWMLQHVATQMHALAHGVRIANGHNEAAIVLFFVFSLASLASISLVSACYYTSLDPLVAYAPPTWMEKIRSSIWSSNANMYLFTFKYHAHFHHQFLQELEYVSMGLAPARPNHPEICKRSKRYATQQWICAWWLALTEYYLWGQVSRKPQHGKQQKWHQDVHGCGYIHHCHDEYQLDILCSVCVLCKTTCIHNYVYPVLIHRMLL